MTMIVTVGSKFTLDSSFCNLVSSYKETCISSHSLGTIDPQPPITERLFLAGTAEH